MNVVMLSMWMNDAERQLHQRAEHLLAKTGVARWVWVYGDCADNTPELLAAILATHPDKEIELVRHDTGVFGEDPPIRLQRMSQTVSAGLDLVRPEDDYWLLHESDLRSPDDVVAQLLVSGHCPVAGWVTLGTIFYDTWGYRADGTMFGNHAPYHARYVADQPFEVDSVGSCWLLHAEDLREGVRCASMGVVELCEQLRARGRSIWVDPRVPIVQPTELWEARRHA